MKSNIFFTCGIITLFAASLSAQVPQATPAADPFAGAADPFAAHAAPQPSPVQDQGAPTGMLHFEAISLPTAMARKALMAHPAEGELYAWLDAALDKKDSGVTLELVHSMTVRNGQLSKSESIDEFPFPTEFDPSQIPQTMSMDSAKPVSPAVGSGSSAYPWPHTPITPTSFTIRNLGWSAEAELTFSEDGKYADLNLAPGYVRMVSHIPWALTGEIQYPVMEAQKVSTQIAAIIGRPTIVSTFSPPLNTGVAGGNKIDRTWLLFVTVNVVE